jgi:hypothetical protein
MITASIEHRIGSVIFSTQTVKDIAEEMRLNAVTAMAHATGSPITGIKSSIPTFVPTRVSSRAWTLSKTTSR